MDHIMEQLEFYRKQYLAAMNQVEQSVQEGTTLRAKYTDMSNENIRLQQRTHHLEKKLNRYMETIKHEKDGGNSQSICAFVEQCNEWKKKYDSSIIEMEKMRKEADMCKKLCDDLSRDRNSLALEKDGLKQQVTNVLREKNMYHDDIKEMTKVLQSRADELRRVTAQRNAAEHELRTILAERKGVLEENQKLSDDLTAAREEIEKHYKEDKKLTYENESLKREIESVLRYKDDLMKECTILREKLEEVLKARESTWKNGKEESKDKFVLSEQHALDVESANLEIEKLRKSLERAMTEIEKSTVETEVAKSRRDWAISEREKIVLERDSVKILCDELRKERDTAISNLLAAIRDSERPKKQKDEACRELDHIREQIDLDTSRRNIRWIGCTPYDLEQTQQKNDTEIIELDMSAASVDLVDLGIVLEGGREDSQNRIDSGIVVVSVATHSIAYGKLRPNDCIIQVNNLDCASVSKRMVHETIRTSNTRCTIIVKRPKVNKSHMYAVQLNMAGGNRNHGLTLETGVFITNIAPGSLAAREDDLLVGDRVLSINSKTMEGIKTAKDAMAYLDDNRTDSLSIISLKQIAQAPSEPAASYSSRVKHNKMVNICTQTEMDRSSAGGQPASSANGAGGLTSDIENQRNFASSNSKSTSKISEILNKFKGKMHIPGHHSSNNQKGSTVSESDSLCQENDAIEVLDSVLNNENASVKSKDNLFKRSKRSKKDSNSSKEANKNLGTWPRANVLLSSATHENHSGTIVQSRKKERPPLSFFTGPISLSKEEKQITASKKDNYFQSGANNNMISNNSTNNTNIVASNTNSTHKSINRNSNPIPFYVHCPPPPSVLNRHSVYDIETEPVLLQNRSAAMTQNSASTLSRNQKMSSSSGGTGTPYHVMNPNRLSLNIPTTANISHLYNSLSSSSRTKSPITDIMMEAKSNTPGGSQQQNSLDHISFKNSIDSFLNPKSTMSSMDFKRNSMQSPQHLKDMSSLKSQNSIDSFLLPAAKSPPSIESTLKQIAPPPRESFELYNMRDTHSHRMYRNVSKYPSDSDSLGMDVSMPHNNSYTSTLPSYATQSRMQQSIPTTRAAQQRLYYNGGGGGGGGAGVGSSGTPSYLHTHNVLRQSSPLTLPLAQTIDNAQTGASFTGGVNSSDKLELEYNTMPSYHHAHVASLDVELYGGGRTTKPVPVRDRDTIYGHHPVYEGGTFPRKKENQRFRIPSNPSVTSKGSGVKNSTGSIEHGSERGSPMPPAFQVEVLSHGANKRNSMPDYCYSQKPSPGYLRRVTIDKSVELGITITCNTGGGIFVSTVAENSIASQVSSHCKID